MSCTKRRILIQIFSNVYKLNLTKKQIQKKVRLIYTQTAEHLLHVSEVQISDWCNIINLKME